MRRYRSDNGDGKAFFCIYEAMASAANADWWSHGANGAEREVNKRKTG